MNDYEENDLLLVRYQAIAWVNNDGVHPCMYARLSLNVLMAIFQVMLAGHTVNIPGASFTLTLERRPLYYLLNIIIPSLILAALSALSFAVPVDSGEKLSFSMSILVAFSVFMLILQENTPEADSPLLGKYTLIARFMGPTWGQPGADRTQVGPMLALWTLLYGQSSWTGCIKQSLQTVPCGSHAPFIWFTLLLLFREKLPNSKRTMLVPECYIAIDLNFLKEMTNDCSSETRHPCKLCF